MKWPLNRMVVWKAKGTHDPVNHRELGGQTKGAGIWMAHVAMALIASAVLALGMVDREDGESGAMGMIWTLHSIRLPSQHFYPIRADR